MTLERLLEELTFDNITLQKARSELESKDHKRLINYFINRDKISKDPMQDNDLSQLKALVEILQILYNSAVSSPISDDDYDTLQEILVDMGIPRLSGSLEINASNKIDHRYTNLRGTLGKIYYLNPDERRTNKSRKYLDEWIKSMEVRYEKKTGKSINLNDLNIILQCKFDGCSVVLEIGEKMLWLTRGDTSVNKASDVSHIMNIFNDLYADNKECGIKFEAMITEENKDKINKLYQAHPYKNSRQIVTAVLNSNEPDFKADYIYPVPLRIMRDGDLTEQVHPDLIEKFPTLICKLSERDKIKQFANQNKWVLMNGMRFRTDGVVMTILDSEVQSILGRENNINQFEIAYKFTEETAKTKVRDIEYYLSEFGYITPVVVFNDVILKGNRIQRASISNKERFDELFLSPGDEIIVQYDIIPYVTKDDSCTRVKHGRKFEFIKKCPRCGDELDLDVVQVQCHNNNCPSRKIGRILNYCNTLRIQNIGYETLESLYEARFLEKGIRSLYKLKKKAYDIEDLDGFGKLKARKIINEIESKRRLKDYEFFGALGIEGLSVKTFQSIFTNISYSDFVNLIKVKNFDLMMAKLISVEGIAEKKADALIHYLRDSNNRKEIEDLINELSIYSSYGEMKASKGIIVFSGLRSDGLRNLLEERGWKVSDAWTNKAKYLVVPSDDYESSKTTKAKNLNIPVVNVDSIEKIR